MTTPTPLQRLSEIVEAVNFDDPLLMGDTRQFERVANRLARFLASPEAVEVLAKAAFHYRRRRFAFGSEADPVMAPWYAIARTVLASIAEQALKEPK